MVGLAIPVEGPWVWLGDTRRVGSGAEVCQAGVETVVEGWVYARLEPEVYSVKVLLRLMVDVVGGGRVVEAVVVVVRGFAFEVSSSLTCDLSVIVTARVVCTIAVTIGMSVRVLLISDALVLAVAGAAVRPRPTSSPVWDETTSVALCF